MSWPEPPDWLELEVTPRRVRRGETITATLRPPDDAVTREIGLACLAHYAAPNPDGGPPMYQQGIVHDEWHLLAAEPFVFLVPGHRPYSYEGEVISFYWGIWLRRELRALEPEAYLPLWVDP